MAVLWRSRWILILCAAASLGAGFVYIRAATRIYTVTVRLYLDYRSIAISQLHVPEEVPRTDKYLQTQAERLRSRPILAAALAQLTDPPLRTFRDTNAPIAYLRSHLVVTVGKKDETVSISLDCPYPDEAAQIVNTVVKAYMISRSEGERQDGIEVLNSLETEANLARRELEKKREELKKFQANDMPLTRGSEEGGGVMQSFRECQSAYEQARDATSRAKRHLEAVQDLAADPAALAQYLQAEGQINEYAATWREQLSLEARLTELGLRKQQLLEMFTANHPIVVSVVNEMEQVHKRAAALNERLANAVIAVAQRLYVQAQASEQQKVRWYEEQCENLRRSSAEQFSYRQLLSDVQWQQTMVQTRERELEEIRKIVGNDVGQINIKILEPAQPAASPSWPQKPKILAFALMLGLCLGGGIGVARNSFDQTLRSVEEIVAALELPVLGTVPLMPRRHEPRMRGRIVSLQPDSPVAEAYRAVRTAVFFGASGKKGKTLLVTSPGIGDGKSTLVSNLGIAMANAGQKVLILDADFRTPTQHLIFEVNEGNRRTSLVMGGKLKLMPTQVEGLSLLVAGQNILNPAELLTSRRFAHLLAKLAEMYDRVLIDAPSVIVVTDAQILGALCDCVILVLKADKSTHLIARRAVQALQSVGAELLGAVVNEAKTSGGRHGYYGRCRDSSRAGSKNGSDRKPWPGNGQSRKRQPALCTSSKSEA